MRHPDLDTMVQHERWQDDVRAAVQYRLIKEAEEARRLYGEPAPAASFTLRPLALALARLLSFIGEHFVVWSCRLQYRYAVLSGAADSQPCR